MMSIEQREATEFLPCWRCQALGLPDTTIFPGDKYYLLKSEVSQSNCCSDCYDKIFEELNKMRED
jgi:hypothetical protein